MAPASRTVRPDVTPVEIDWAARAAWSLRKQCRRVATRYQKVTVNYLTRVNFTATVLWL